jgi:aldehyde:ferredoxin oxidoreductase
VADALQEEEAWRQVLSSLVICFFARGVYTPEIIQQALATLGVDRNPEALKQLGADILKRKRVFKQREGFDLSQIRIPQRILDTPSSLGKVDEDFMRQALEWLKKEGPG